MLLLPTSLTAPVLRTARSDHEFPPEPELGDEVARGVIILGKTLRTVLPKAVSFPNTQECGILCRVPVD